MQDCLLKQGQQAWNMLQFVKVLYPKIYDDICKKIVLISEEEVWEMTFTKTQYFRLRDFCGLHDYTPDKTIEEFILGCSHSLIPNLREVN